MAKITDPPFKYKDIVTHSQPLVLTLTPEKAEQNANAAWFGNETSWNETTNHHLPRKTWEIVLIGTILGMVIMLTIGGNLLVCVTIATNKKLKTCTNYFILSLATTDLLLGCIVLPFSALNTIDSHWPLGYIFCNVYTSCDVMLCTVSILTLFAISLDRYFAVTIPLRYHQKVSGRMVSKILAGIWVFSFVMAFLPINVGWNTETGQIMNKNNPTVCIFELNKPYVILVSLGTYFGPLVIMCGVYLKVLQITRTQVKEINKLTKAGSGLAAAMLEPSPPPPNQNGRHHDKRHSVAERNGVNGHGARHSIGHKSRSRENKMLTDTKATVTLASVILAFAICWVPYFVLFTAKPFLTFEFNIHLDLVALWLGYVNSSINPFLYAFYNSSFREGFRKILCRHCLKSPQRLDMQTLSVNYQVNRGIRHGSSSETSDFSAHPPSL